MTLEELTYIAVFFAGFALLRFGVPILLMWLVNRMVTPAHSTPH